jgi:hypothetical protein
VGARTDAARAEVLASREALLEERNRLEASARAAFDIPAKIRREPVKTAGLAAGAGFLLLGGPKKTVRGVRSRLFGKKPVEAPPSLLPDEVQRIVDSLGAESPKVKATLEREFADYLDATKATRRGRGLGANMTKLAAAAAAPVIAKAGQDLAERLFNPDANLFDDALAQVRKREAARREGDSWKPGTGTGKPEA